jgi:2-hydroxychromene-2-carboxylate isomerase
MSGVLSTEARLYHAFRSPYSRLGLHVVKRAGLNPPVIPFTGPPDGVPFSDPVGSPPKLLYYMQDAPRMTLRMGLPIKAPDPFEIDFTPANRALVGAGRAGLGLDFAIAAADARWGEALNLSVLDVLKNAARAAGWSAAGVEAAQADASIDEEMSAHRRMIAEDGVFGVPFGVVRKEKFWGHDRFGLFVEALQQRR